MFFGVGVGVAVVVVVVVDQVGEVLVESLENNSTKMKLMFSKIMLSLELFNVSKNIGVKEEF